MKFFFILLSFSFSSYLLAVTETFNYDLSSEGVFVSCSGNKSDLLVEVSTYGRELELEPFGINNTKVSFGYPSLPLANTKTFLYKSETINKAIDGGGFYNLTKLEGVLALVPPSGSTVALKMEIEYNSMIGSAEVTVYSPKGEPDSFNLNCIQ